MNVYYNRMHLCLVNNNFASQLMSLKERLESIRQVVERDCPEYLHMIPEADSIRPTEN